MTAPLWQGRRVIVCVGTGGVGKTTCAASLAVAAAGQGVRTLVMTIDPARRLANALGIGDLGNVEREISAEQLAEVGLELRAPLWVMMPDVKRTFDDLIERTAPNAETRERILRNRVYQHVSSALAGSHEYAAVEKLHEVYATGRYELIVLDTPPSQNAVDFFEAPSRVLDFLDNETLQLLLKPYLLSGKLSLRLLDIGSSLALRTLGRLAGGETIRELAEFVLSFRDMYDGFRERSRRVRELLRSEEMAFLLVTGTTHAQRRATLRFYRQLNREGFRVRCMVANRVRRAPPPPSVAQAFDSALADRLAPLGADVLDRVRHAVRDEVALAERDGRAIVDLQRRILDLPLIVLPELPADVHDLAGLAQLHHAFVSHPDPMAY